MALDRLSTLDVLRLMNEEDALVPLAVRDALPAIAQAVERVAAALAGGGRRLYVGAGARGRRAGRDAAGLPPTVNTPPEQVQGVIAGGLDALTHAIEGAEDDRVQAAADIVALEVSACDVVMGIAASGGTPYVLAALEEARRRGAVTVGLACNAPAPLLDLADVPIAVLVGPEVLTGSTRLKAGTAQKMVLNMITTASMVRLGKVYENLMIDVQPTNSKLRARARRIVAAAAGIAEAEAAALLEQAGQEIKTAIFMARTGADALTARQRLAAANGHLRRALEGD